MIIQIDTTNLEKDKLSPEEIMYLLYTVTKNEIFNDAFNLVSNKFEFLEESAYIKYIKNVPELRYKALDTIKIIESKPQNNFEEFIEMYRNLFKGKKLGSMGDKNAIIKKMQEFKLKYPQFNEENILIATEKYIDSCRKSNYKYLQRADYFIFKNSDGSKSGNISNLATWCEETENMDTEKGPNLLQIL